MNKNALFGLALAAMISGSASAQTIAVPAGVPQTHLDKAKAEAFGAPQTAYFPGLLACYGSGDYEATVADPPPTKVFDNLYYVGKGDVGPFALVTSGGIVLFDALNDEKEAQQYIVGGLKTLGLNPADIKYVVITHGHGDHFGGAKYLKATYGARILASKEDWAFMEQSKTGGRGGPPRWAELVPDHDMDIADGQKLTIGNETLTFYVTPGHTPGSLSTIIPVTDHGAPHVLAFWGGFALHGGDAAAHAGYDRSVTRFEQIVADAKAEGFLNNHPAQGDVARKLYHVRTDKDKPNAFLIGARETRRYLEVLRECNLYNADVSAAQRRAPAAPAR